MARKVEIVAPAKINLRLKVLAQQTSGYHALESVFCSISLADHLSVEAGGDDIELVVDGDVDTGLPADNLVTRAARRFYLALGSSHGVRMRLRKVVPSAAGLGGGSSDAAAALIALNALHGAPFSSAELIEMGGELGSDVPFFLCGSPLALGWGRGDRLLALPPLPTWHVVMAHPDLPMPTGQAFQRIAELRGGGFDPPSVSFDLRCLEGWESLAAIAENDFEAVALEKIEMLAPAKRVMLEAGARIALLAGSGSSFFGVFPDETSATMARRALSSLGLATSIAHTLDTIPKPTFA